MGVCEEWRDITYTETFEQELRGIQRRMETDPSCTIADLEGILRNLYHMEGSDWGGRGELQNTILAATIAAYERFIASLQGIGQEMPRQDMPGAL